MKVEQIRQPVCPASLRRGQVKRVSLDTWRPLYGYVVVCPHCGRPTFATPANGDVIREEHGALVEARCTCGACGAPVVIEGGEFVSV